MFSCYLAVDPLFPRALIKTPWKSILWVTPLGTCAPWSHMQQAVMVIYWINWLVKKGGKAK